MKEVMRLSPRTTSWVLVGVGAAATALGATVLRGPIGAGAIGFGAAHVLLGLLDMTRPTIRKR